MNTEIIPEPIEKARNNDFSLIIPDPVTKREATQFSCQLCEGDNCCDKHDEPRWELYSFKTEEGLREKGFGTKCLEKTEEKIRKLGYKRFYLKPKCFNKLPSVKHQIEWLKKRGWKEYGECKDHYHLYKEL